MSPTPVNMLMILDGWGINPDSDGNAVAQAATPFLDRLLDTYPHGKLACAGPAVGLPQGTMGNSEVGHMNIGAGRVVPQDLMRINAAVEEKRLNEIAVLTQTMEDVKASGKKLHLMGLLSDGGVHSHITHLFALLDLARELGVPDTCVHVITDGRDTPPKSAKGYIKQLQDHLDTHNYGRIATITGRFYAMDRDTRWERVEEAFDLYTIGNGNWGRDGVSAIQEAYDADETDEFIKPIFIEESPEVSTGLMEDGDSLIFFNFRADRAREITRAFTQADFDGFDRQILPKLSAWVTMTQYDETFELPVIFGPQHLSGILGEVLSKNGVPQLRIAETEKYAHVTYFLNGGDEAVFEGEDRILVPSPRDVATYDLKPGMSAEEVAEKACNAIESGKYGFIVLNFANMDMVGHTGIMDAAVDACQVVDRCVEKVVNAVHKTGGTAFVTADHGNSEQLKAADGTPHTAHTLNPVHFVVAGPESDLVVKDGVLGDIAPTILKVMGLEQPPEMTGSPLV